MEVFTAPVLALRYRCCPWIANALCYPILFTYAPGRLSRDVRRPTVYMLLRNQSWALWDVGFHCPVGTTCNPTSQAIARSQRADRSETVNSLSTSRKGFHALSGEVQRSWQLGGKRRKRGKANGLQSFESKGSAAQRHLFEKYSRHLDLTMHFATRLLSAYGHNSLIRRSYDVRFWEQI